MQSWDHHHIPEKFIVIIISLYVLSIRENRGEAQAAKCVSAGSINPWDINRSFEPSAVLPLLDRK